MLWEVWIYIRYSLYDIILIIANKKGGTLIGGTIVGVRILYGSPAWIVTLAIGCAGMAMVVIMYSCMQILNMRRITKAYSQMEAEGAFSDD